MLRNHNLFSDGGFSKPGLYGFLEAHRQETLQKIRAISDLDQLNEDFLSKLVKDSLVEPLALNFEKMTFDSRTEQIAAEDFPFSFHVLPGKSYPKTVMRISVPFTGNRTLLELTPNQFTSCFPVGEVRGNRVQFDILLWGGNDDEQRAKRDIDENRGRLELYAGNSARQVREFNESLPAQVKETFEAKVKELSRQHSIFADLGIKAEEKVRVSHAVTAPTPKKPKTRDPKMVVQFVMNQYVEQLNQTNNNTGGDVNNAIQSN